jgi:hypothetical protein
MNDKRAMAASLFVGITWSASKSGKLHDLKADEGISDADRSWRTSRHDNAGGSEQLGGLAAR